VPFSNPNVEEIPEVAREHTILSMLGVTSHTPRTHELLSAHNMVSAWNGLTTKVQVGEWRKVKFIGCGCSQGPKDYFNTVAKMSTFDRAYENATILIFHRLQTAHNSDDSNVTINTPSTTTPRKPHPRAAKVVTPFPDTARATTPARITKQDSSVFEKFLRSSHVIKTTSGKKVDFKTENSRLQTPLLRK
tara:strand:+ start:125 stop:694 length:570 start_codon:yes stop_codon:yes gene_type:complete